MKHRLPSPANSLEAAFTRRQFLTRTTLAAAAAFAAPMFIPASALGRDGHVAPSERINVALIGLGKLGRNSHLPGILGKQDAQVVALCDVDRQKLEAARKEVEDFYQEQAGKGEWKGCATYGDFRVMLERPDIDGVIIATPNHWHALQAIAAARAGKDIYCEKPLSLCVEQSRAMVDAVRRHGRILQTGSQQRSDKTFRLACEIVRNSRIGKIKEVYINIGPFCGEAYLPAEPTPEFLDWDMWLGPAPDRPYSSKLAPSIEFKNWPEWRYYRDYAGGGMNDFGAHHFDIAQWALGMDHSGPVEVHPPDGKEFTRLTYIYENGVRMIHGGGAEGAACDFIGENGRVQVNRGDFLKVEPAGLEKEPFSGADTRLYESNDHQQDWLDCIRSRRQPICDVEIGARSATVCHLGNICYWLNRPLKWDPVKEQFINDDAANRLLRRPMRAPWTLT